MTSPPDELGTRREERTVRGITYEWSAVRAYAREFAAEELNDLAKRHPTGTSPETLRNRAAILTALNQTDQTEEKN
jgi:hypothetical protein